MLVVAAGDLPAGALLSAGDLRTVALAAAAVPPGSFSHPAQLPGRRLATPLREGSPLMQTSLVGTGLLTELRRVPLPFPCGLLILPSSR
ncbi:SAF domain-containing protein [Arthrobacter sp. ATA002]|uniref:SAF domain-containing protein n=1 Tax=Arthrobacter sp. ATA002 TaxID=2991715 RepID=UPI0022A6766F|nr:SAF domain-containing protein [Arthrobacter sp. ATA002]WAP52617.1 SAF domain-containing protein [Arthrobacter sp. ATA002]